jgi:hypothetical protein
MRQTPWYLPHGCRFVPSVKSLFGQVLGNEVALLTNQEGIGWQVVVESP